MGLGKSAKAKIITFDKRDDYDTPADIHKYKHQWAKLIWQASGRLGNFDDIADRKTWLEEERRCVVGKYNQAEQVLECFKSVTANKYFMSFNEDEISMSFESTLFIGNHTVSHNIYWSVD